MPPMKFVIVTSGLFLLLGCQSASKNAVANYEFVKAHQGSKREICEAARKVVDAYQQERDSENYLDWRLKRDVDCNSADIEEL